MAEEGAQQKEGVVRTVNGAKLQVMQWGYLPASSPHHLPLLLPTLAPPPSTTLPGQEGWMAVCIGGCGFALAISESGKLHTWGSTCDLGQSYVTAGKHEERPEPFPLPSENPVRLAAAGWAHCVVVTDKDEVYAWGWKECVPSISKLSSDERIRISTDADKAENVVDCGKGSHTIVLQNPADMVDPPELPSPTSVRTSPKSKMCNIAKEKVSYSVEKMQERFSLLKRESAKSPKALSMELVPGVKKSGEEGTKRRRVVVEHITSSDISAITNDENVSALPCLVTLYPAVKIVSVAAGGRHSLALSDTGEVWAWGYGGEGQLGLGSRIRTMTSPNPVPCFGPCSLPNANKSPNHILRVPGSHAKVVACGGRHSAVLTDDGALLTFGWGLYGQCGQGSTDDELSPSYVSSLGGVCVKSVAAGLWHTVCTSESGDVYSFGGNQFGQLGTGGDRAETLPRLLEAPSLENVHAVSVSCGARHTAICTDEGRIFSWGWNKYGQLGLGDTSDRGFPEEVSLGSNYAKQVSCGWWHTLALVQSAQ